MHEYEHTQAGTLMRLVFGGGLVISGGAAVWAAINDPSSALVPIGIVVVFVTCVFLFHALTVSVSCDTIVLRFGIGLIRKRFAVADIQKAVLVRNHWYYGWGIKLTPHGWLYNVSGFDAVEIQLSSGRKYRIGTDEPDELCSAIEMVIRGRNQGTIQHEAGETEHDR